MPSSGMSEDSYSVLVYIYITLKCFYFITLSFTYNDKSCFLFVSNCVGKLFEIKSRFITLMLMNISIKQNIKRTYINQSTEIFNLENIKYTI